MHHQVIWTYLVFFLRPNFFQRIGNCFNQKRNSLFQSTGLLLTKTTSAFPNLSRCFHLKIEIRVLRPNVESFLDLGVHVRVGQALRRRVPAVINFRPFVKFSVTTGTTVEHMCGHYSLLSGIDGPGVVPRCTMCLI